LPTLVALAVWNYYPLIFLLHLTFHRFDALSLNPMWIGLDN
jgi:ABC-type sugar transport system permease subunit